MTEESKKIFDTKEVCDLADPRSPNIDINRTPLSFKPFIKTSVFDPRSPTVGIDRTPIQVKDVQKPLHHQQPIKVLPIHNSLSDPRSPTQDFLRTPLKNSETEMVQKYSVDGLNSCLDPRSPTVDFIRTPMSVKLSKDKESIIEENDDDDKLQNSLLDASDVNQSSFSSFEGYIKELEDSKTTLSSDSDNSLLNQQNDLNDLQISSEHHKEDQEEDDKESSEQSNNLVISKKMPKHQVFKDENSTLSEKQTNILLHQKVKSSPLGLRSPLATIGLRNSPLVETSKKVSNFDPNLRKRIQTFKDSPTRKSGFNFQQEN